MATAVTSENYLQQIHTARTQLYECFRRAHELLSEREAHLLRELDTIQDDYDTETNSQQEELQGLEVSKQSLKDNLRDNDLLNEALVAINRKIQRVLILSSGTARNVKFKWDTEFDGNIQHAGEIVTTTPQPPADLAPVPHQPTNLTPVISQTGNLQPIIPPPPDYYIPDYKNKSIPIITCCKHNEGTAPGVLYQPNGLAIEPQSGRI